MDHVISTGYLRSIHDNYNLNLETLPRHLQTGVNARWMEPHLAGVHHGILIRMVETEVALWGFFVDLVKKTQCACDDLIRQASNLEKWEDTLAKLRDLCVDLNYLRHLTSLSPSFRRLLANKALDKAVCDCRRPLQYVSLMDHPSVCHLRIPSQHRGHRRRILTENYSPDPWANTPRDAILDWCKSVNDFLVVALSLYDGALAGHGKTRRLTFHVVSPPATVPADFNQAPLEQVLAPLLADCRGRSKAWTIWSSCLRGASSSPLPVMTMGRCRGMRLLSW